MSRAEQARLGIDDDIQRRLDAGNAAYEEKFGFVFLIRAAGRSAEEILESLDERMNNTPEQDRKSTRLNSSHVAISYAVFCLKKKKKQINRTQHKKTIE